MAIEGDVATPIVSAPVRECARTRPLKGIYPLSALRKREI